MGSRMLKEKWKKRFNRWFKLRFAILYPLGVWTVLSQYSTDASMRRSIWFILIGLSIRAWANFYAIKTDKLTTSGPYAYVRHPLYLGTFFIFSGFLIMLKLHWLLSLVLIFVFTFVVYGRKIKQEEQLLLKKFGSAYVEYQKAVPGFLFTFKPFKGGEKWAGSFQRYFVSQEYKLLVWILILVVVFHMKEEYIIEGENVLKLKNIFILTGAAFLGALDVIISGILKKYKRRIQ